MFQEFVGMAKDRTHVDVEPVGQQLDCAVGAETVYYLYLFEKLTLGKLVRNGLQDAFYGSDQQLVQFFRVLSGHRVQLIQLD
jgi:hypothetical protein